MPQVTIYLPDDLLQEVRLQAKQARLSLSAYMSELTRKAVRPSRWPAGFLELYGSCTLAEPAELSAESVYPF